MEEGDLWRLAAMLLQKYGEAAETYASIRADEALNLGNNRAYTSWRSLAAAVGELEQSGRTTDKFH
jgi:hypothetical protein